MRWSVAIQRKRLKRWCAGVDGTLGECSLFEPPAFVKRRATREGVVYVELSDVFVHASHRGNGVGRRLVARALRHADKQGWCVWLRVCPHGDGARLDTDGLAAFYRGFGFVSLRHNRLHMIRRPPHA